MAENNVRRRINEILAPARKLEALTMSSGSMSPEHAIEQLIELSRGRTKVAEIADALKSVISKSDTADYAIYELNNHRDIPMYELMKLLHDLFTEEQLETLTRDASRGYLEYAKTRKFLELIGKLHTGNTEVAKALRAETDEHLRDRMTIYCDMFADEDIEIMGGCDAYIDQKLAEFIADVRKSIANSALKRRKAALLSARKSRKARRKSRRR